MKRIFLFATAMVLGACATTKPAPPREPANLPDVTAVEKNLMRESFKKYVATKVVMLAPPDARGVELPICQTDLYDRPDLALPYVQNTQGQERIPLDLPKCSPEQQSLIHRVAGQVAPKYAVSKLPTEALTVCALDFAAATVIMTLYTSLYRQTAKDSQLRQVHPDQGWKLGTMTATGLEALKHGPNPGARFTMAMTCTAAGALLGTKVGYLLVPNEL